jgi:hypothetical protein
MTAVVSAGAAAAAAAKRRRQREEEEEATFMNTDPTGAFEYKILRSATSAFRNPAFFRAVMEEESRAGWELVEKLDNDRVRLRRLVSWREKDSGLTQDPYRIWVGMSQLSLALCIVFGILAGVALIMLLIANLVR